MTRHEIGATAGVRQGASVPTHSVQLDFGDTVGREIITIDGRADRPVLVEFGIATESTMTGGTVSVGTTQGGTEILNGIAVPAIGAAVARTASTVITAKTKLYAIVGGAPGAGRAHLLIWAHELNRDKAAK